MNSPSVTTEKKTILIVDDDDLFLMSIRSIIVAEGHEVRVAASGKEALDSIASSRPSLVLLDIGLPGMNGEAVCRKVRELYPGVFLPIILISGGGTQNQLVQSLAAGANDFVAKPFRNDQLLAKVRSFLGVKTLYDTVRGEVNELDNKRKELESRISENTATLTQLRRFLSPQVADLVVSSPELAPHKSHRKEVSVVFVDLRGFTPFAEKTDPEEVSQVLSEYYREVGTEVLRHEGTIGCLAGDGIMCFFNDPTPIENHTERALEFALSVRHRLNDVAKTWNSKGHHLNFGIGIASGPSTIGVIGFEGYWGYSVIGIVPNIASRLCSRAAEGQILISKKCLGAVQKKTSLQEVGEITLKGVAIPVRAYNVINMDFQTVQDVG